MLLSFFDDTLLEDSDFTIKRFKSADEELLDFVVRNSRENYTHSFDIVIGAVG